MSFLFWPVLLVDRDEKIQLWNTAARRLFGVGATTVVGVGVDQLPIESGLRKNLIRHCRMVLDKNKPSVMRNKKFSTATYSGAFDLHFTSISKEAGQLDGVLVMSGPQYSEPKIGKPRNSRKK